MAKRKESDYESLDEYKHHIFKMLMVLGCSRTKAASLLDKYDLYIRRWRGDKSIPIATAEMVARLILRDEDPWGNAELLR